MSSIYETAHPRFKQELAEIYTPPPDKLNFLYQRLRVSIADVSNEIITHIANIAGVGNVCKNELHIFSRTGSGQR